MKNQKFSLFDSAFLALFLPMLMEQFTQTLMGNIDTALLSLIGDDAVAAVGMANQILVVSTMILGVVPLGGSIILNQLYHHQDSAKKHTIINNMFALNVVISLVVSGFLVANSKLLLTWLQTPAKLFNYGISYLVIVAISLLFQSLIMNYSVILRSISLFKTVMIISLIINIINAIGNIIVIISPFEIFGGGVIGIAVVTTVSRIFGVILYAIIYSKHRGTEFSIKNIITVDRKVSYNIFRLGFPSMLESVSYNVSTTVQMGMIATLGATILTSRIYTVMITNFIFMFAMSWSMCVQIMVARQIGNYNDDKAYQIGTVNLKDAMTVIFIISIIISIFSPNMISLLTPNQIIIDITILLIALSVILEPLRCGNTVLIAALNAAGEVRYSVIISIIVTYLLTIPLSYLVIFKLKAGILGVWLVMIVDELVRFCLLNSKWRSRRWSTNSVISTIN